MQNYENSRKKTLKNICKDLNLVMSFLYGTPKVWDAKGIIDKPDFIKIKTSALMKTLLKEQKDKPENGENIQKTHL